jgi:hypothetical protein
MITLPALAFDKLALSINTHGLGAGRYYRFEYYNSREAAIPCDFIGHFETCFGEVGIPPHRFGITGRMSDRAVFAINKRKHAFCRSLVNWTEFVGELGIYRGAERLCDLSAHESSVKYNESRGTTDATPMERQSIQR